MTECHLSSACIAFSDAMRVWSMVVHVHFHYQNGLEGAERRNKPGLNSGGGEDQPYVGPH